MKQEYKKTKYSGIKTLYSNTVFKNKKIEVRKIGLDRKWSIQVNGELRFKNEFDTRKEAIKFTEKSILKNYIILK